MAISGVFFFFKLGRSDSGATFSVALFKLSVHMACPGAAKERLRIQGLGGTAGAGYEWDWPAQI